MNIKTAQPCVALQMPEGMECERCGLAWDIDDATPQCEPMTYKRMRAAAERIAEDLEASQRAWVAKPDPLRTRRSQEHLKRAMEMRAIVKLIDRVRNDAEIVERLKHAGRAA